MRGTLRRQRRLRPAAGALIALAAVLAGCRPSVERTAALAWPTWTPAPTRTATPSPTATPTATATLHPLTLQSMRQRQYPGSDVVIEGQLDPGLNYARYLASYLSEGLRIFALLTVPNGEAPAAGWPVIVFNHGFIPPDEYRTTERYVAYVDNLARAGYIVFRPDYRGHGDSEGVASGAYGSPDYVVDVLNAVASMRRYPAADSDRIGMWGHSMGGYITLRAMVIDPGVRAGVIWAGVVGSYPDLLTRWRRTATPGAPVPSTSGLARGWRSTLERLYGSPEANPDFYASISAQTYLSDLSGPLQLHHGTGDTSVPWEFSSELYQLALQAGDVVELFLYEGADHNLSGPFRQAMQRTIEFFDRYLKGAPPRR